MVIDRSLVSLGVAALMSAGCRPTVTLTSDWHALGSVPASLECQRLGQRAQAIAIAPRTGSHLNPRMWIVSHCRDSWGELAQLEVKPWGELVVQWVAPLPAEVTHPSGLVFHNETLLGCDYKDSQACYCIAVDGGEDSASPTMDIDGLQCIRANALAEISTEPTPPGLLFDLGLSHIGALALGQTDSTTQLLVGLFSIGGPSELFLIDDIWPALVNAQRHRQIPEHKPLQWSVKWVQGLLTIEDLVITACNGGSCNRPDDWLPIRDGACPRRPNRKPGYGRSVLGFYRSDVYLAGLVAPTPCVEGLAMLELDRQQLLLVVTEDTNLVYARMWDEDGFSMMQ